MAVYEMHYFPAPAPAHRTGSVASSGRVYVRPMGQTERGCIPPRYTRIFWRRVLVWPRGQFNDGYLAQKLLCAKLRTSRGAHSLVRSSVRSFVRNNKCGASFNTTNSIGDRLGQKGQKDSLGRHHCDACTIGALSTNG